VDKVDIDHHQQSSYRLGTQCKLFESNLFGNHNRKEYNLLLHVSLKLYHLDMLDMIDRLVIMYLVSKQHNQLGMDRVDSLVDNESIP